MLRIVFVTLLLLGACSDELEAPEGTFEGRLEKAGECPFTTDVSTTLFYDGSFLEGSMRTFDSNGDGQAFATTVSLKGRFELDNDLFVLERTSPDGVVQTRPATFRYVDGQLSYFDYCAGEREIPLTQIR